MELWQAGVILASALAGMWLFWKVDVATRDWKGDTTSWITLVLVGAGFAIVASAALDILPR